VDWLWNYYNRYSRKRLQKFLKQLIMSTNKNANGGIGLGTILFLIFMVLKLTNNITWSWWWVTSPLWIPIALVLFIAAILLIFKLVK
jgi:hypothetical protein